MKQPAAKELQLKVLCRGRVLATQQLDNDAEYADLVVFSAVNKMTTCVILTNRNRPPWPG